MVSRRIRVGISVTLLSMAAGALAGLLVAFLVDAMSGGLTNFAFDDVVYGFGLAEPQRADSFVVIFGGGAVGFAIAAGLLWWRCKPSLSVSSASPVDER